MKEKTLHNIINEAIEDAFESLQRKLFEQDFNALAQNEDPLLGSPEGSTGEVPPPGADPSLDPNADPGNAEVDAENDGLLGDEEEEEKDPVDQSFNELMELSKTSGDIGKIISAIKGYAQDAFSTPDAPDEFKPEINDLFQKIVDDKSMKSNLLKKAIERPELNSLRSGILIPSEDSGED